MRKIDVREVRREQRHVLGSLTTLAAVVTVQLTVACGSQAEGGQGDEVVQVQQAFVCGADDRVDVEFYDGSNPAFSQAWVGKYQGPIGNHCSGALISPDLFMTNVHGGCTVEVGESVCFNRQVDGTQPYPSDPVAAATARRDCYRAADDPVEVVYPGEVVSGQKVDIAVTRLSGKPGLKYGWLTPTLREPVEGEDIAVIQHPCCSGWGYRKAIAFGHVVETWEFDLRFWGDLTGGGSGSPVLDTNGFIIGVARADHACTDTDGYNKGTTMRAIFDHVAPVREQVVALWTAGL